MSKIQGDSSKQIALDSMQGAQTQRTMTSSMTMKTMRTMKTTEINASTGASQDLIEQLNQNADDEEQDDIETQRSKITMKQKLKYTLHWFLIVVVHL